MELENIFHGYDYLRAARTVYEPCVIRDEVLKSQLQKRIITRNSNVP